MNHSQTDSRDQEFVSKICEISDFVKDHSDLVGDDSIYQYIDKANRITQSITQIKQEGRLLKIGIVGCVKAGKSSFLNALVFNGKQILPKAPTPMTAALTKLSYSKKPEARIVFYQQYDWKNICKMNDKYTQMVEEEYKKAIDTYWKNQARSSSDGLYIGLNAPPMPTKEEIEKRLLPRIPESLISSHELVTMVKQRRINPQEYLGREEVISGDPNESPEEYIVKLEQFVGSNGKFTPLVNHIELAINNPLLEGFEIIDTPGLNDPIISRSQATKAHLMNCDVVFIVCQVGQFLTRQDISLISDSLSSDSVANAFIIGTQLDSGLLQYNRNVHCLNDAYNGSLDAYEAHAESMLEALSRSNSSPLIQRLKDSLPPVFVSAMIFSIAKKMEQNIPLNAEEQHIIDGLKLQFTDFEETLSSVDDYYVLANIEGIKDRVYENVRDQKNSIIEERIKNYTNAQTADLLRLLDTIHIVAGSNLDNLRTGDAEYLREKLTLLQTKLDSIRLEVRNIFDQHNARCSGAIENIKIQVAREVKWHSDIDVEVTQNTHRIQESCGFLGLMKRYVPITVVNHRASASQAVDNVRNFGTEAQALINDLLGQMFQIEELKKQIKDCVIGAFDLSDQKFNEEEILIPLDTMLLELSVEPVTFDDFIPETEQYIYNEFPTNVVEGNDIHKLKRCLEEMMSRVIIKCQGRLDERKIEISNKMKAKSALFVDQIIQRVSANINLLQELVANREENIARYESFMDRISRFKQELYIFQE